MIRPFTCVCLALAAGSGLYLYQVKQRAFALDAELRGTFHAIDEARERTRMLRADWALMNDPERLQALASQYLTLQPMAPSQLMTMDQLAAALPPPIPPGTHPAAVPDAGAPATDPTQGMPMAEAAPMVPPHAHPTAPDIALLQPPVAAPAMAAAPVTAPPPVAAASVFVPAAPVPAAPVPPPSFAAAAAAPSFAPALSPGAPLAMMTPPPPKPAQSLKPVHHGARHSVPGTQPWLAEANGTPAEKQRRARHHAAPEAPPAQFYAANEAARLPDATPRITPPAATVMYSPASGSALGMAASAALAPPRPLYSTSQ